MGWIRLTAALFSVFTVTGYSMEVTHSLDMLIGSPWRILAAVFVCVVLFGIYSFLLGEIYDFIDNSKRWERKPPKGKIGRILEEHPFGSAFFVLTIFWLPYLIAYYPGIFMGDTGAQISQFFQLPNGTSNYLNLISQDQLINNHHPVLHTVLMGGAVKIGREVFHSDNLGIFLYTLVQFFSTAAVLSCTIAYLKKLKLPIWCQSVTMGIFALYPIVPRYVVLLSKDTLFADSVVLFVLFLVDVVRSEGAMLEKKGKMVLFFLTACLMCLLRQNGVYVLLFSLPILFVFWKKKKYFFRFASVFIGSAAVYFLNVNALYPALLITPGSRREALSIPFQQTARCVKEYGDEITKREKEVIDQVLDYDKIGKNYDPDLSDPVKNTFREDATGQEMKEYFQVWGEMLLKYPKCYVEAFLDQTYGYFYIWDNGTQRGKYYEKTSERCMRERIDGKGFSFHSLPEFKGAREGIEKYSDMVHSSKVFSVLESPALYTWITLGALAFLLRKRKYAAASLYLPAVCLILVNFLSPVNGTIYFRYALPLLFLLPLLLGIGTRTIAEET